MKTTTGLASLALAGILATGGALAATAPAFADDELPADENIPQEILDEETPEPLMQSFDFQPLLDDPLPDLEGSVSITGTPQVGNTLQAIVSGWPEGTELTYEWFYSGGNYGGEIPGETGTSYVVEAEYIGLWLGVVVTGSLEGFADTWTNFVFDDVTFAPQAPAVGAPVADSSGLADFLENAGSTPVDQQDAGLPSGPLSPGSTYTAQLDWLSPDSFVDVYSYSSPVFVGTFPVVNGVVQITLSSAILQKLGAGTHTLVVMGQSSGAVSSVSYGIARTLAVTGSDVGVAPFALAGLMLMAGVGVLVARRRALA